MTDAAFLELLASYERALDAAESAVRMARALAEAHRDRPPLSDAVVAEHLARADRDEQQLAALRGRVSAFKGVFRVH